MARTAVVILNWNGRELLERFLPSVVGTVPAGVEVVVADNGSTDGSAEYVESAFAGVTVVRLDENYGFAGGYNRALSRIVADYYVLLNSDVETTQGWLEPLIAALDADPQVAAVQPKILAYRDPAKFEYAGAAGGFIDCLGYPFCRGRIMSTVETDAGQYDDPRDIFWASGACMVVRSDVWRQAGGLDEAFFAHMEEIDLCWRMQLAGYRIRVEPAGVVRHVGGATLAEGSARKIYLNHRNSLAMLYKNLPRRRGPVVVLLRMCLDALSALVYLVQGRRDHFRAVYEAHRDYRRMKPALREKRTAILAARKAKSHQIYRGFIILRYIFGRKTFGRMM